MANNNISRDCRTCGYKLVREKEPGAEPCGSCPSGKEGSRMTNEEAIRELSLHLMQCGAMMPIEWVVNNGDGSRFMEAFKMAMDALKGQKKEQIPLLFTHRKQLSDQFIEWANKNHVANTPMSVIAWLTIEGLIDLEKAHAKIGEE